MSDNEVIEFTVFSSLQNEESNSINKEDVMDKEFDAGMPDGAAGESEPTRQRNEKGQVKCNGDLATCDMEQGTLNAPNDSIYGNDTTNTVGSSTQFTKVEVEPSFKNPRLGQLYKDMLAKMPVPNKGPVRFPVWSPYTGGDGIEFEFRLSRSGDLKRGKYDMQVKLRASKQDEDPVWISPGSAKNYKDAGYRVPIAPKVMGLDRVASTDVGDLVLITDSPLDYYALNCALLRESVTCFGKIEEDPGEAVGCAVMALEGYEFDDRISNDFLTEKRVFVIDYGRNSEEARKIAGNISSQRIARSVSVWRLDAAAADQGLFKRYKFPECETAFQLKFSCADLWSDIRGRLDYESEEVTASARGGMLYDLKREFKPAEFYLYPFIPRNGISLLCGEGGTGKSTILMNWAARLSRGENELIESHYDQDDFGKVNVLWLTREESREVVVGPRAVRSGADEQHFRIVQCIDHKSGSKANLKFGDRELEEIIAGIDVADEDRPDFRFHPDVVFIDSLQTFIKGDTNNGDAVVAAMDWLLEMAGHYDVSFCLIHHFRKGGGDFRDSISGRHEIFDYARLVSVAVRDPKMEKRTVVHVRKLNDKRGVDEIPNLLYEIKCDNERDAKSYAEFVKVDPRSEEEILAQMEQRRLDAKEKVTSARKSKAEAVCEVICDEYETNKIIPIESMRKKLIELGFGQNSITEGMKAAAKKLELVRKSFSLTIFFHKEFDQGMDLAARASVYVSPDDALETPDGIAKLALRLKEPLTAASLKREVPKAPAKNIKLALEALVELHGFVEVNKEYRRPESVEAQTAKAAVKIGDLARPISIAEAMELTGADEDTVKSAFERLVSGFGFTLSRDGQTVTPPQSTTPRGNADGQQVLTKEIKSRVL